MARFLWIDHSGEDMDASVINLDLVSRMYIEKHGESGYRVEFYYSDNPNDEEPWVQYLSNEKVEELRRLAAHPEHREEAD